MGGLPGWRCTVFPGNGTEQVKESSCSPGTSSLQVKLLYLLWLGSQRRLAFLEEAKNGVTSQQGVWSHHHHHHGHLYQCHPLLHHHCQHSTLKLSGWAQGLDVLLGF